MLCAQSGHVVLSHLLEIRFLGQRGPVERFPTQPPETNVKNESGRRRALGFSSPHEFGRKNHWLLTRTGERQSATKRDSQVSCNSPVS